MSCFSKIQMSCLRVQAGSQHALGAPAMNTSGTIALPNEASVRLHRKVGFTEVGTFAEYAIKHGSYVSSVWMQRAL